MIHTSESFNLNRANRNCPMVNIIFCMGIQLMALLHHFLRHHCCHGCYPLNGSPHKVISTAPGWCGNPSRFVGTSPKFNHQKPMGIKHQPEDNFSGINLFLWKFDPFPYISAHFFQTLCYVRNSTSRYLNFRPIFFQFWPSLKRKKYTSKHRLFLDKGTRTATWPCVGCLGKIIEAIFLSTVQWKLWG